MDTDDFCRSRLDAMMDFRHLPVLMIWMLWASIEAMLAPLFARRARVGWTRERVDLFGEIPTLAGAGSMGMVSRPRLVIRFMVGLLYRKRAFNESDESVRERWAQDVCSQFFWGEEYFPLRLPCASINLLRLWQILSGADVEALLALTIAAVVQMTAVASQEFERVTSLIRPCRRTLIAYPAGSLLLDVACAKLV
ncbi:hypothetical protein [Paraburkholderia aspalathi]|uniref:hypothetical protein n=1 Tax=Paraburkholderia aspalathi TaxID=1324617 RepID=UPI0038BBA557